MKKWNVRAAMVAALGATLGVACSDSVESDLVEEDATEEASVIGAGDSSTKRDVGPDVEVADAQLVDTAIPPDANETDVDSLAWLSDATTGAGVSVKDTLNTRGNNVLIVYAGFNIEMPAARAWATAVYRSQFRDRGVRHLFAVQGPASSTYAGLEIGNSKIASALVTQFTGGAKFAAVLAHSSGSFVAHELLNQLAGGVDPGNVTAGKLVYYNMEGDSISGVRGVSPGVAARLKKAYFVSGHDGNLLGPNFAPMQSLGNTYGEFIDLDMAGSGCAGGYPWCVHISLVNEKPYGNGNPDKATANKDYTAFDAAHPVNTRFIANTAAAAGL